MIDSHCHLDLDAFADDVDEVIRRSQKAGVDRIMIPGTRLEGWSRQYALARKYPMLDLALGLHPYYLHLQPDDSLSQLVQQLADAGPQVRGLGEIGLDAAIEVDFKLQQHMFQRQLSLAQEHEMPVILHHRKTHHQLLAGIKQTGFSHGGVVHAFSGSLEVAEAYLERGFLLGIGGTITYERAQKTRTAVSQVPIDRLLLETDAPDMPMCGRQGQRNSPEYLGQVLSVLSELREIPALEVAQITSQNYCRLFNLSV